MRTRATRNRRSSFTLLELMIVIAIIAALMALSASATIKFLGSQQEANTRTTLDKVQSQLNKAWSKVKDQAYKETIPSATSSWIQANLASNTGNPTDPNVTARIRVIYVKLKLRQAFPMTFAEALDTTVPGIQPLPAYQTYLTSSSIAPSVVAGAIYESSACLLMALQRGVSGAGVNPEDLTRGGATGMAGSLPYLNDAWGRPIFFTRVPVGSAALNTSPYQVGPPPVSGGQPGANDPLDPNGYLQAGGWATAGGQTTPQATLFVALTKQQLASANSSYKLAPLVASGGQNNWVKAGGISALGFDPTTFAPTSTASPALFSSP